jgi:membrane protein
VTDRKDTQQKLESLWHFTKYRAGHIASHTWKAINDDLIFDSAAALSYYFLLSLFPGFILVATLLATFGSGALMNNMLGGLQSIMPGDAYQLLSDQMRLILQHSKGGLLTFGILATIWAASSAVVSLMDGINRAYEVTERRSFIRRRLVSLGLLFALTALTIAGSGLLVSGGDIAQALAKNYDAQWIVTVGTIVGIVLGVSLIVLGLEVIFYFAPDKHIIPWYWATPGSIAATIIFGAVSFGFSEYLHLSNAYSKSDYGSFGAVIVLMLWLYFLGLAILVGGEINCQIMKALQQHEATQGPKAAPVDEAPQLERDANGQSQRAKESRNMRREPATPAPKNRPQPRHT